MKTDWYSQEREVSRRARVNQSSVWRKEVTFARLESLSRSKTTIRIREADNPSTCITFER